MYISKILTKTSAGKISHVCILLRESYRDKETKKVRNRTIANLTHCNPQEIEAIRLALKNKKELTALKSKNGLVRLKQGKSIGAVLLIHEMCKRLGVEKALGSGRSGKLALFQIMSRIISQGSRLSSIRQAQLHSGTDVIGIREGFNEDTLYKNLAWLAKNQKRIEKKLFEFRSNGKKPELFLYDVTSSYMEGKENELSDWGYNRDKKKGKKQVVVGLLCDEEGSPVSVEVFQGNTKDTETFSDQIKKVADEYGCKRVTFVGDRGMIKSGQITELKGKNYHYITAITKPQIKKLIKEGTFQLDLFSTDLCEIETDGKRYILRFNPIRAQEIAIVRDEKRASIEKMIKKKNTYLLEHGKASMAVASRDVRDRIKSLKLDKWLKVFFEQRTLRLQADTIALETESELDGCYVVISDLPKDISKETIHKRYKDLANVEHAFRTMKTVLLEIRPWYVCTEASTRGHALVVMLSYLVVRHLKELWSEIDLTVEEGLEHLSSLCSTEITVNGEPTCQRVPDPSDISEKLLKSANVTLPEVLPSLGAKVISRKKLPKERLVR